jgi:cobalt/nickel transport system permease protein
MHIPDGYLSPATCAALYGGATPFWYVALRRVRTALHTRLVPRLSLFAAFCFVIMMFNLPLPGGTTGHAVGIGLATVVLGPWAAILAVSIALIIQALFFGDGGITAIGANCFNMAIVGSMVSYGVYRAIAGRSTLTSARRVVAAGLAGYAAINLSALCAAIEFGIQPMLYRDAAGAPLYCPYPLSIAIPAMMIGHLTIAGLAELFVSAGVVAFLQQSDPSLLRATSGLAGPAVEEGSRDGRNALRPLWLGLGALMILTPLGILAGGAAWGEWVASDYADPAVRQQIAASSLNQAPPAEPPKGLERLSSVWTAPFAQYAPPYVRSRTLGYLLSSMFGVGLVMLGSFAASRLLRSPDPAREEAAGP